MPPRSTSRVPSIGSSGIGADEQPPRSGGQGPDGAPRVRPSRRTLRGVTRGGVPTHSARPPSARCVAASASRCPAPTWSARRCRRRLRRCRIACLDQGSQRVGRRVGRDAQYHVRLHRSSPPPPPRGSGTRSGPSARTPNGAVGERTGPARRAQEQQRSRSRRPAPPATRPATDRPAAPRGSRPRPASSCSTTARTATRVRSSDGRASIRIPSRRASASRPTWTRSSRSAAASGASRRPVASSSMASGSGSTPRRSTGRPRDRRAAAPGRCPRASRATLTARSRPRPGAAGLADRHQRASMGQPRRRDQDVGARHDLGCHLVPDARGLADMHRLEPAVGRSRSGHRRAGPGTGLPPAASRAGPTRVDQDRSPSPASGAPVRIGQAGRVPGGDAARDVDRVRVAVRAQEVGGPCAPATNGAQDQQRPIRGQLLVRCCRRCSMAAAPSQAHASARTRCAPGRRRAAVRGPSCRSVARQPR